MITLEPDRLILMFGGAYGELLNSEIWLYNINTNLWQDTYIADKSHRFDGFFYNCLRCDTCNNCKNETNLVFDEVVEASPVRRYCEFCTDCQTDDKVKENLSLYHDLDPVKTFCPTCLYCYQYSPEEFLEFEAKETLYDTFEVCEDC